MWKGFVLFAIILVCSSGFVLAESANTDMQRIVDAQTEQANKFLSAELSRQIKTEMETVKQQINDNNDENMRMLDSRMANIIIDVKQKIILGTLGAILVAQAIIGLAMMYVWRRYSFEYYQSKIIQGQKEELEAMKSERDVQGIATLQQADWQMQQVQETAATRFGQAAAANVSMMNQWQTQPAYQGAWVSPQQVQKMPAAPQQQYPQQQYPQWEGGNYGQ